MVGCNHHHGRRHMHGGFGRMLGRGRHGGGGRLFESGNLRLLILHLIAEMPRHGYEIIKAIEERLAGAYSPSPGVVYPTLTLLEELGQVTQLPAEGGRKQFAITPEGRQALAAGKDELNALLARMDAARAELPPGSTLQLMRAMHNLRLALRLRLARGGLDGAALAGIVADLDQMARRIEQA